MNFGNTLKYEREKLKMTREDLAKNLSLKYSTLANYENNARQPDFETLKQISNFFHVSIDYLLGADSSQIHNNNLSTVSSEDLELLQKIKNLPADRREIVDTVIKVSDTTVIKKAASEK